MGRIIPFQNGNSQDDLLQVNLLVAAVLWESRKFVIVSVFSVETFKQ